MFASHRGSATFVSLWTQTHTVCSDAKRTALPFKLGITLVLPLICLFLSAIQTYTAIYYVIADLLMLGMYSYYKAKNRMNQSECFSVSSLCLFGPL